MSSVTNENNVNKSEIKERFLECNICNEEFDETVHTPRLLPCLHTFCQDCIGKLIEHNNLKCPFCKTKHQIQPTKGTESFPKDNTRRDLLQLIGVQDPSSAILCKACDDKNTAKYRCKNCADFLCDPCYKAHRRTKYTKDHKVLRLDELKKSPDLMKEFIHEGFCKVSGHETVPLKLYCSANSCCKPICYNCAGSDHRDPVQHPVQNIAEVYENKKHKLKTLLDRVKATQRFSNAQKEEVDAEITKLVPNLKKIEQEIDASFGACIKILEQRRQRIKEDANQIIRRKFNLLKNQKATLTDFIDRLTAGCRFTEETLKYKDVSGLLEIEETIETRLRQLQAGEKDEKPCTNAEIMFSNNRMSTDYESFVNQMGMLSSTDVYPRNTKITITEPVVVGNEHILTIFLRNCKNETVSDKTFDIDVEIVDSNGTSIEKQTCSIQKNGADYKMKFTPTSAGPHRANVKCLGGKLALGIKEFEVDQSIQKRDESWANSRPNTNRGKSKSKDCETDNEKIIVEKDRNNWLSGIEATYKMSSVTNENNVNKTEIKERFLECYICNEEFDETVHTPRCLPCLHTFCQNCIGKLIEHNNLKCPFCKTKHQIQPTKGTESFPKDNTRRDLLQFIGVQKPSSTILCKACDDKNTAKYRCKNCAKFLCDPCYKAHRRTKYTKDHKVLRLDCSGNSCCKPICYNSAVSDHRDPDQQPVQNIAEVYENKKHKLKTLLDRVKTTQRSSKAQKEKVDAEITKLEPHLKKIEQEIDASFAVFIKSLEQRRERIKEEANQIIRRKFNSLNDQKVNWTDFIDRLTAGCRFTEKTIKYKDVSGLLEIEETIETRLRQLQAEGKDEELCNAEIMFSNNRMPTDYESFTNQMRMISFTDVYPWNTKITITEPVIMGKEHILTVILRNYENEVASDKGIDIDVEIVDINGTCIEKQSFRTQKNSADYRIRFTPISAVPHHVTVKCLGGKLVLGIKQFEVQQTIPETDEAYTNVKPNTKHLSTEKPKRTATEKENQEIIVKMDIKKHDFGCFEITFKHYSHDLSKYTQEMRILRTDVVQLLRQANEKGVLFVKRKESNQVEWNSEIPFESKISYRHNTYQERLQNALKQYGIQL